MTTPKRVVLWGYAPLKESEDNIVRVLPTAARYHADGQLPDPRVELHLESEGVRFNSSNEAQYPPLAERVQRLITTIREGPSHESERCLAHLAALDRSAAVEIAREWSLTELTELSESAQALVTTLVNFPGAGDLEAYLDGLGLTDVFALELHTDDEDPITLQEELLHRGRALAFSLHRQRDSICLDELLRKLAALAPGALDGLLFKQLPPDEERPANEDVETGASGQTAAGGDEAATERFVAYGGGKRYEGPARGRFALDQDNQFIDVAALLDFLNALARARGSDMRWVIFDTDGNYCSVAAGPAASLEALQARGLLPISSPERIRAYEEVFSSEED